MTVRVPVSPGVLDWALERAHDPAEEITASMPKVREWLAGDSQPTVKQLASFASRTGTPFGYLLLRDPPELELPMHDFREGFGGRAPGEPSADLLAVVHQNIRRQDWYRDYAIDNGLGQIEVVGRAQGWQPAEAAADMRATLNYEIDERRGNWADQRRYLIREFEDIGGLTVATSMVGNNTRRRLDPKEFRGFSLVDDLAPLVFINTSQTLNGQIFTLAHEFAHVWGGVGGVGLEEMRWQPQNTVERWCNDVASEFLVPGADLRQRFPDVANLKLADQLQRLAHTYRCGTLVVLLALRRLGLRPFNDFDATYDAEAARLHALNSTHAAGGKGQFWSIQPYRIGRRLSHALIDDTLGGRTAISEAVRLMSLKSVTNFDTYAEFLKQSES